MAASYQRRRNTLRLPAYDYSRPGAYFITLCTRAGEQVFGEVENGAMLENAEGRIVREVWNCLPVGLSRW